MAKTQRLDIVTPEKLVMSEEVDFVVAPGTDGELGFLPEHAPLVTTLKTGVLRVHHGQQISTMAVIGGFVETKGSRVVVLADTAERAEDIDAGRAEAAKKRAEERLVSQDKEVDMLRAEKALHRSIIRLQATSKAKNI
ncbi:MAG: F0F1 ATP synthase subunit epsilon [Desulfotomaculum sp.]|nr:F0F1 ATP synthase subunit epsilon [Desulfotomaculum sp.]